ncbi:MAG TPA: hypothetical protein VH088_23675 [Terriglobales bacterium]|nr:hypothetical protein [Terriglobales bacterium]
MRFSTLKRLCILALCLVPASLLAQTSKPPIYTYVAFWDVPRAQWPEVAKGLPAEKSAMDKLVADGTLIGYGAFDTLLHQENGATHGTWFTASSEGNILKALEFVYKQPALVGAGYQAASKHFDQLFTSETYGAKSGSVNNGYLSVSRWQFKPGSMHKFMEMTNKTIVPVLDKLVADGTLLSYGEMTEDYHTQGMGVLYEYFSVPDAASMDKVSKAIDEVIAANPSIGDAIRDDTDPTAHRDYLNRIMLSVSK